MIAGVKRSADPAFAAIIQTTVPLAFAALVLKGPTQSLSPAAIAGPIPSQAENTDDGYQQSDDFLWDVLRWANHPERRPGHDGSGRLSSSPGYGRQNDGGSRWTGWWQFLKASVRTWRFPSRYMRGNCKRPYPHR